MNDDDLPAALRRAVGDPPPGPDHVAAVRLAARRRSRRTAVLAPAAVVLTVLALVAGVVVLRPSSSSAPVADDGPPVVETALPTPQPRVPGCRPGQTLPAGTASVTRLDPDGHLVWSRALPVSGEMQHLPALVVGDTTVVADGGRVHGLALATGRTRWTADPHGEPFDLWLSRGTVVVLVDQVSEHARLVGYDATTGERRWTRDLAHVRLLGEQQLTDDGGIVLHAGDRTRVVDTDDGSVRWSEEGGAPFAVVGDGLVVEPVGGRLLARDLRDGTQRWATAPLSAGAAVALAGDVVVTQPAGIGPSIDPHQHAFDLRTGAPAWTSPVPRSAELIGSGGGVVLFAETQVSKAELYAVDARTGAVRWHVASDPDVQPALVQGDVVVLTEGYGGRARTARRSLSDGALLGGTPLEYEHPPFAAGPDAYLVQSSSGAATTATVTVTTTRTGTQRWSTAVRHAEAPPTALPDGSVLVHGISPGYVCF